MHTTTLIPARASGMSVRRASSKAKRKSGPGPVNRTKKTPKISPEEAVRIIARRMSKAERDERVDITMSLTPPKTYMGGFTRPRDLRASNWWRGGAYLRRGKEYELPPPAAYQPHTVFLLESRYPVIHGVGRVDCIEHVTGVCRADDFPALVAKYNSPRCPGTEMVLMDNARWPWTPQRKPKRIKWWTTGESPGQLVREWRGDDAVETSEFDRDDDFVEDDFVPPPTEKVKGEDQPDSRKQRRKITIQQAHEVRKMGGGTLAKSAEKAGADKVRKVTAKGQDMSTPAGPSENVTALSSMLSHAASVDVVRALRMRPLPQSTPLDYRAPLSAGHRQIGTSASGGTPAGHTAPTPAPGSPNDGSEDGEGVSRATDADKAHPAGHTAPTISSPSRDMIPQSNPDHVKGANDASPAGHTTPTPMPTSSGELPSRRGGSNAGDSSRTTDARENLPAGHTPPTPAPLSSGEVPLTVSESSSEHLSGTADTAPTPTSGSSSTGRATRGFHTSVPSRATEVSTPTGAALIAQLEEVDTIDIDEGESEADSDHSPASEKSATKTERAQQLLRDQYFPTLADTPFWRPLLTVTLSTRPLAVTLGRLARARPRGMAYYASIHPDDRKTYLSFSTRMRNMRIDRITNVTLDIAQMLHGFRGGFVGIRFNPRDRGRSIDGEGLARGTPFDKRVIQVGVGNWYARRDEVKEAFLKDATREGYELPKGPSGEEPLVVYDVDEHGVRRNDQGEVLPWPEAHTWDASDLLDEWTGRVAVEPAPSYLPEGVDESEAHLLRRMNEAKKLKKLEVATRSPKQLAVALAQKHRSVKKA